MMTMKVEKRQCSDDSIADLNLESNAKSELNQGQSFFV